MVNASGGGEAVTQWELPAAKAWKAVVLHSPDRPILLGKLLPGIAVEQLPEGRGENAPCRNHNPFHTKKKNVLYPLHAGQQNKIPHSHYMGPQNFPSLKKIRNDP